MRLRCGSIWVAGLLMAGCTNAATVAHSSTLVPLPSDSGTSAGALGAPTASTTPGGPSPFIPKAPFGTLLIRSTGVGSQTIILQSAPRPGSKLTVRMTCVGPGKTRISDHTGGLIMATGGCARGAIYSSAWTSTTHDGRTITVTVAVGARWAVDVWLGNPAVVLAGPTSA